VLVDPADMVCDKVVTDQIAAYAPVRANGHQEARLYSHALSGDCVCTHDHVTPAP
jgi:hypothetical protein